jgi:hypothetical protein
LACERNPCQINLQNLYSIAGPLKLATETPSRSEYGTRWPFTRVGSVATFIRAARRDLLVTVRDKVATLKKQGRSLDEIVVANPTAAEMRSGEVALRYRECSLDWFLRVFELGFRMSVKHGNHR